MNSFSLPHERSWDVLLLGGASGTGKTSVSYRLAHHFEIGITEVDDLQVGLRRMTTPEQQPILHYWHTHPEAIDFSEEKILDLHIAVGRVLSPMLEAVIENHVEARTPVVLEGDYILPELLAQDRFARSLGVGRVRGVFLYEPDESQLLRNFLQREPEEGAQRRRAHISWLYGQWLKEECGQYGVAALPARPWNDLLDRILQAIR